MMSAAAAAAAFPEPLKRLDFDDDDVSSTPNDHPLSPTTFISQAHHEFQRLCSGLSDLHGLLKEHDAIMESSRAEAEKHEHLDVSRLKDEWLQQKFDFIKAQAENGFLSCILEKKILEDEEAEEGDLEVLEREHAEMKHVVLETTQAMTSLIETYATEMTIIQEKTTSIEECLHACKKKISQLDEQQLSQNTRNNAELAFIRNGTECSELILDKDVQELRKRTYETEIEVLRIEKEIDFRARQLHQLQQVDDILIKAEQVKKILEFLYDVSIVNFKDGYINLIMKTPLQIENDLDSNSRTMITTDFVTHKMLIKVNEQTFDLLDAKLDPADVPMDDIVCAAKLRGSDSLLEPRKSLDFLLRRTRQRISMHKSNSKILYES